MTSKARSSYQRVREPILAGFDSSSKNSERQNVSKLLTLPSAMCRQSFVCELVQSALSNILFDLAVPNLSVKLKKPPTESGKFRRRETSDFLFDIFDFTHGNLLVRNISRVSRLGLTIKSTAAVPAVYEAKAFQSDKRKTESNIPHLRRICQGIFIPANAANPAVHEDISPPVYQANGPLFKAGPQGCERLAHHDLRRE